MKLERIAARTDDDFPSGCGGGQPQGRGDVLLEAQSATWVVLKLPAVADAYLQGVSRMLDEWKSPENRQL